MSWVGAAVGAGLGVLSSLWGASEAASASRSARAELARQEREEKAWYERAYNTRYADTSAGQALLSRARDYARDNWKKAEGTNRVAGGTDASVAKAKEQGNKMVGDTIQQIAAADTTRKDNIDLAHRNRLKELSMARAGIENQRAQNITAAAGQASNALISAGAMIDGGLGKKNAAVAGGDAIGGASGSSDSSSPSGSSASAPVQSGAVNNVTPNANNGAFDNFWDDMDLSKDKGRLRKYMVPTEIPDEKKKKERSIVDDFYKPLRY